MLFDSVNEPAFVMTSANPPSEPIVTNNQAAIAELGPVVDYFLFHNRNIVQRCDDSVVRAIGENQAIIRRSRGYAPEPIYLGQPASRCALGVGAELNVTSCVLLDDKAFVSQHIGDVETFETYTFLKEATNHLIDLTNSRIDAIGCDLHPRFNTKRLAQELGEKFESPVVPVQHHYAHIAALMAEHGVEEIIGISCDGYGYGADGKAWGGEILYSSYSGFERLGHFEEQPMIGGDMATKYPARMVAGILYKVQGVEEWLHSNSRNLPYGKKEVEVILKQLDRKDSLTTTSCGRILDAVSTLLGICQERTYEGEPAMKLESAALGGQNILNLEPMLHSVVIDTTCLLQEIFDQRNSHSISDLAYSAQHYLAQSLAESAVEKAEELGIKTVGFSGGVAYNQMIALTIKKIVEKNRLKLILHEHVPPGDGGIAFGQAAVASRSAAN
jgi:hydrogenase maturation protein HypF